MQPTCYMCDAPATSSEHAPPRCLFPSPNVAGEDMRRNLITVPSCDAHNSAKSKDDEYLRAIILLASGRTSGVAKAHFFDKQLRAIRRKPHTLSTFVKPVGLRLDIGEMLEIDLDRFNRCITSIASALFFDAYGIKMTARLHVISPNLYARGNDGVYIPAPQKAAIEVTREYLANEPVRGENPKIFLHRVRFDSDSGMFAFAAIFYEAFEVFCATPYPAIAA